MSGGRQVLAGVYGREESCVPGTASLQLLGFDAVGQFLATDREQLLRGAVRTCVIAATGTEIHPEGYGPIAVFRIEAKDGTTEHRHRATSNFRMGESERLRLADASWRIEEYHCGREPVTNAERCQCRRAVAQRVHIVLMCGRSSWSRSGASEPAPTGSRPRANSSATPHGFTEPSRSIAGQTK